jgi:hypothetical protein
MASAASADGACVVPVVIVLSRIGVLAIALLELVSCSQASKNATEHFGYPLIPKTTITSISLNRLGCKGSCPVYSLTFSAGDSAMYEGKGYVDKIGRYGGYADFDLIAAWLDSQSIDNYAGQYGLDTADAENIRLIVSRGDRIIVIYSGDTDLLPVHVQGAIAALDGFGDAIRWKALDADDSYLGYFLNENTPSELFAARVSPGDSASDVQGFEQVVHVGKCADDGFASDQFSFHVHLVGARGVGKQRSYNNITGEFGPESPITMLRELGGLTVGNGSKTRYYSRVTWSAYNSAYGRVLNEFRAACKST